MPSTRAGAKAMAERIDLRSDTLTKPSPEMRDAMARAEVGDEQKGEDPTVSALEERVGRLLGQQAAIFVPSATMANQIALQILTRRGDELLADALSHVFVWELGGPAALSGLVMKPIAGAAGTFTADQLEATAVQPAWDRSGSAVVSFENTHAETGGRIWEPQALRAVVSKAREHRLRVHLDGARLMNASVASGASPAAIAGQFDTVTLCLSKGLGCPAGALLATSDELIPAARRAKQMLGGAMRQTGILAAAGLYALDNNVERLATDHDHARLLAVTLHSAGIPLVHEQPDTNIVLIDLRHLGPDDLRSAVTAIDRFGVSLSTVSRRGLLRAVTHMDVSRDDITHAGGRIASVLTEHLRATIG